MLKTGEQSVDKPTRHAMKHRQTPLPWLEPGQDFPPTENAWGDDDPVPGLLAAGGVLDVRTLLDAYSSGIFPWFSEGQPILWWSPQPRMVLQVRNFRLHRSLRKTLTRQLVPGPNFALTMDKAFSQVIRACATAPREGQAGTWIVEDMISAYIRLHKAGHAHSVETWCGGKLVGGLYCVNIGKMVFGESMFALQTDASKIALAALVAFCRVHGLETIDCQQKTSHLASFGAAPISRGEFAGELAAKVTQFAPNWDFMPSFWHAVLPGQNQLLI